MNWVQVLAVIMYVLEKIKDSDGDGRLDMFDSNPNDPTIK